LFIRAVGTQISINPAFHLGNAVRAMHVEVEESRKVTTIGEGVPGGKVAREDVNVVTPANHW
jgi:hypothetical protein